MHAAAQAAALALRAGDRGALAAARLLVLVQTEHFGAHGREAEAEASGVAAAQALLRGLLVLWQGGERAKATGEAGTTALRVNAPPVQPDPTTPIPTTLGHSSNKARLPLSMKPPTLLTCSCCCASTTSLRASEAEGRRRGSASKHCWMRDSSRGGARPTSGDRGGRWSRNVTAEPISARDLPCSARGAQSNTLGIQRYKGTWRLGVSGLASWGMLRSCCPCCGSCYRARRKARKAQPRRYKGPCGAVRLHRTSHGREPASISHSSTPCAAQQQHGTQGLDLRAARRSGRRHVNTALSPRAGSHTYLLTRLYMSDRHVRP